MHRNACAHFKGFTDLKSFLVLKVIWWCLFLTAADNIYAFPHCVSSSWLSKPFSHSSWSDTCGPRLWPAPRCIFRRLSSIAARLSSSVQRFQVLPCSASTPATTPVPCGLCLADAGHLSTTVREYIWGGFQPLVYAAPLKCNAHWYSTV